MTSTTQTLRISASGGGALRVSTRRHQFVAGRPIDFDVEAPHVSALEYALGAAGAEVVGGFLAFARRRRLVIHEVEAVVTGEVANAVSYLEVVGEDAAPRLARIQAKVYVASSEDAAVLRAVFDAAVARLPFVGTLRASTQVDLELILTV
jgi:hypothetical protein